MIKLEEILALFKNEFKPVLDKFEIIQLLKGSEPLDTRVISKMTYDYEGNDIIWHPGCYVFYGNGKPYKVGRHLTNSRKRVMEHIEDNTGGKISELVKANDREIILFNVKDPKYCHWTAAVEIYMETVLREYELVIHSKRQG